MKYNNILIFNILYILNFKINTILLTYFTLSKLAFFNQNNNKYLNISNYNFALSDSLNNFLLNEFNLNIQLLDISIISVRLIFLLSD